MKYKNILNRVCFTVVASFINATVCAGERVISSFSLDKTQMTGHITCSSGEGGVLNALYLAWSNDGADKGADISSWSNVCRIGLVPADCSEFSFSLPSFAEVTAQYAARVFLYETKCDYDYLVEGVKSSGTVASAATCYVDTGVYPIGNKTITVVECKMNNTKGQQYLFGCNDGNSSSLSYCSYINGSKESGGKWAFACNNGGGNWNMASSLTVSSSERVVVKLDGTLNSAKGTVSVKSSGDVYSKSSTAGHNNQSATALTLWARNNGTSFSRQSLPTIYSCTIAEDGEFVRDFRPAVKSGVAGLYDSVEGKFYSSGGTSGLVVDGENFSRAVLEGEVLLSNSPVWNQTVSDYVTDEPYTEPLSLTFATGGTKSGAAPLILSGKNNWGGRFTNNQGAVIADFGQGIAETDELILNGGTFGLLTGSVFNWDMSGGPGKVTVAEGAASYGFSAYTNPFSVVFNGDAQTDIEFGSASSTQFNPTEFILNDDWATDTLTFKNGIIGKSADGMVPDFTVYSGAATSIVEKTVSGVGLVKKGEGQLRLPATNVLSKIIVEGGTLFMAPSSSDNIVPTNLIQGAVTVKPTNGLLYLQDGVFDCAGQLALSGGEDNSKPVVVVDDSTLINTDIKIGAHRGSYGKLVVTNDAYVYTGELRIWRGLAAQYGGIVSLFNLAMGTGYAYSTAYNLYGGKLICRMTGEGGFYLGIGSSESAPKPKLNVYEGAEVEVYSSDPTLGRYAGKTGSGYNSGFLNVLGGSFSVVRENLSRAVFYVGYSGSAGLLVSNGLFHVDGGIQALVNNYAGRSASITIDNGGIVETDYMRKVFHENDERVSTLTVNGGKITAQKTISSFISGFRNAFVGPLGATVDTKGYEIEVSQSFSSLADEEYAHVSVPEDLADEKAFTVVGEGALALSGTNTWACATFVSNAVLSVGEKSLPETNLKLQNGVIDLGGYTHTVTNLMGSGIISNGTIVVVGSTYPGFVDGGELVVAENASIITTNLVYKLDETTKSCGRLDVRGAFDVSDITITLGNKDYLGSQSVTLVKGAPLTGKPKTALDENLYLNVGGNKVYLSKSGMLLYIK